MCEVSKIVEELRKNPVFHMSLASKELFHSNVLAWLLESRDSDDNQPSEIAKALAKLFMPKQDSDNGYKVLTVLREKNHFDLIIVFLPDNNDFKDDWAEIEGIFQNSYSENRDLLEKLEKSCRFVVVENKFKSIPNTKQLETYKQKAKINFSKKIKMNDDNTTYYLLAPQVSLDQFEGCNGWETISWNKISEKLSEALETKERRDPFTAKFIEHYANFLKNMLQLTKDIEEKLEDNKNHAFPDYWQDIFELKKIRIHDFYEKLWFSVLLNKITITDEEIKRILKTGSGYTNASGLLDFKITDEKKHVWRGVQIQQRQLRIELEPASKCRWIRTQDDATPDGAIRNYCDKVLKFMNEKSGKNLVFSLKKDPEELHFFGEFKYRYIPLEENEKISIEKLAEMINYALEAIYYTPLEEGLEAEEKNPKKPH